MAVAFTATVTAGVTGLTGCLGSPDDASENMSRTNGVHDDMDDALFQEFRTSVLQMFNALNSSRTVLRAREQDAISKNRRWAGTITAAMDAFKWNTVFTDSSGMTPLIKTLTAATDELPAHGLDGKCCQTDTLGKTAEKYAGAMADEAALLSELIRVKGFVEIQPVIDKAGKPEDADIKALPLGVRAMKPERLAELAEAVGRLARLRKKTAPVRAEVEVLSTLAWLQYAMELRYRIVAAPFLAQKHPKTAHKAFTEELVETFLTFTSDPEAAFAAIIPQHPYYKKTMAGLAAYRAMLEGGPFPRVNIRRKYKQGASGEVINGVKKRLAREGYYDGEIDDKFDAGLKKSIKAYQTTHGYNVTGVLEPSHGRSMNVPLKKRIAQIKLSLQRWRESEIRDGGGVYVRANIPEFKMEVWNGDERPFKNRVVVGNNNWATDPVNKVEGRLNRTKIFSAQIESIVLNPRWNVPMRIRQVEIEMDLLSQPDYLVRHNYVVKMLPDGREIVYQKSGEGNALGKIKFNFPNHYGIFMHDTNLQKFFDREIRAYSHGCVRLDDPLPVAKYFISLGASMTLTEAEAELKKNEPDFTEVKLDKAVPIYIEYNSVGVSDEGRMMFLSDIYWYDRDFFNGKIPYSPVELELLRRKITKPD